VRRVGGFTLAETLVALTLASVLGMLVSTVFLVQNQTYADQAGRIVAARNVRGVIQTVSAQVRMSMEGGIIVADSVTLTVRTPMGVGAVCGYRGGGGTALHMEGGRSGLDTAYVAGIGISDGAGGWSIYEKSWDDLTGDNEEADDNCADEAADTVGVSDDFFELREVDSYHGTRPALGGLVMLFRETEFKFDDSVLEPGTTALFKGNDIDGFREFASGLDSTAAFSYRVAGTYVSSVSSPTSVDIEAIHISAVAIVTAFTGGRSDSSMDLSATIHLGNAR